LDLEVIIFQVEFLEEDSEAIGLIVLILDNVERLIFLGKGVGAETFKTHKRENILIEVSFGILLDSFILHDNCDFREGVLSLVFFGATAEVAHVSLWRPIVVECQRWNVHEWEVNSIPLEGDVLIAHVPEIIVDQVSLEWTAVHQALDLGECHHQPDWEDGKGDYEALVPPKRKKVLL
jgi:hypothetical protein